MAILEPNVKVYTYDYSALSSRLSDELNVAMVINSKCGLVGKNKVRTLDELIKNYLVGSSITALDDITIKTCAKLLQFTPVWVTRALDNTVLAGKSDNGDTIYTDVDYNTFGRSIQYVIEKNVVTPAVSYIKCSYANKTYVFYVGDKTKIPSSDLTGAISPDFTLKDTDADATDTSDTAPTLENLFYNINDIINENTAVDDTNGFPPFLSIEITDSISVIAGPGVVITKVSCGDGIDIQSFKSSTINSRFMKFTYTVSDNREAISQSNYISLGGLTYYNEGKSSSNISYPNSLVPITFFTGNKSHGTTAGTTLNFDKIDSKSFITYMFDKIMKSSNAVKPVVYRGRYTINFGTTISKFQIVGDQDVVKLIDSSIEVKGSTARVVESKGSVVKYTIGSTGLTIETTPLTKKINNVGFIFENSSGKQIIFYIGTINSNIIQGINVNRAIDISDAACTMQMMLFRSAEYMQSQFYNTTASDTSDIGVVRTTLGSSINPTITIDDAIFLYTKVELSTYEVKMPDGLVDILTTGLEEINSYSISGSETNSESTKIMNTWVKVQTYSVDSSTGTNSYSSKYCFYVGNYSSNDPDEDVIRLSSVALTYKQWLAKFRKAIGDLMNTTNSENGITIYDYDSNEERSLTVNADGNLATPSVLERDLSLNNHNGSFAIINRGPSKTRIYKYSLVMSEDDPEIYTLTLNNNGSTTDYTISFVGDKLDNYGRNVFYSYVNEISSNTCFTIIRLNEDKVPGSSTVSELFGNEVPIAEPEADDYVSAFQRYRKFTGIYYDFFFDGGVVSPIIGKAIASLGQELYTEALISLPDIKDTAQLILYRNSLGIDHFEGRLAAPVVPDTTIGEYVTYVPANVYYLERVFLNRAAGKEFAPVFWITNGVMNLPPKYKYDDKEKDREPLIRSQINCIIWDDARQLAYSSLDLSMQKADTTISNCNNVRMINCSAHVMDYLMNDFIGTFNNDKTRNKVVSTATYQLNSRLVTNQEYAPEAIRVVCNLTNNPVEVQENRELVVDVWFKFRDGIREVKVYQKIYKLSQNFDEVQ